mmetsp:Transcript_76812/g.120063  ORF Transcript_76812/g.120063 Transcript_76812/m.120063 type:complete len:311 (-) Transcript_76812:268-1200(-)
MYFHNICLCADAKNEAITWCEFRRRVYGHISMSSLALHAPIVRFKSINSTLARVKLNDMSKCIIRTHGYVSISALKLNGHLLDACNDVDFHCHSRTDEVHTMRISTRAIFEVCAHAKVHFACSCSCIAQACAFHLGQIDIDLHVQKLVFQIVYVDPSELAICRHELEQIVIWYFCGTIDLEKRELMRAPSRLLEHYYYLFADLVVNNCVVFIRQFYDPSIDTCWTDVATTERSIADQCSAAMHSHRTSAYLVDAYRIASEVIDIYIIPICLIVATRARGVVDAQLLRHTICTPLVRANGTTIGLAKFAWI